MFAPSPLGLLRGLGTLGSQDATSPQHLMDRLAGRATTPWSTNVLAVLRSHQGPQQEVCTLRHNQNIHA
jgi:hypothetical protein